jgi:predicted CXXCH cytochrome family protein
MKFLIKNNKVHVCLILFWILFSGFVFAQEKSELNLENDQCFTCHQEDDSLPEDFNKEDIHLKAGLSCSGCHGGDASNEDMDEAMSPENGFVGIPSKSEIPQFCGKCHSNINFMRKYQPRIPSDQVQQYFTSIHGQKLKMGDTKVADCISCHTSHGIFSAKDSRSTVYALNVPNTCNTCHSDAEYMKDYELPINQFNEYSKSVHGIALIENQDTGAPACNDCHGNHGAMPPGISSISHVCGTCHANNMQYFSSSLMKKVFEEEGLHACEECHGYHKVQKTSDRMISTNEESICLDCHDDGDQGYEVAANIYNQLLQVVSTYDSAIVKQRKVQQIGMDDVEISFLLQEGHQSLIQARTLVHTFDPKKIEVKTSEGLKKIQDAHQLSEQQITDYSVRRKGFGIATLFITILVIALFFKIREIEYKQKN